MDKLFSVSLAIMEKSEPYLVDKKVEVCFVDSTHIKYLNKRFFGRNEVTDILSFINDFPDSDTLGELVINHELLINQQLNVQEQSFTVTSDKPFPSSIPLQLSDHERVLLKLFIHGTLHLLGYDHLNSSESEIMRAKEVQYLKEITAYEESRC